jgi:hypothetical protein
MPILTRMPYIKPADRPRYDPLIIQLIQRLNANTLNAPDGDVVDVGHLNYVISTVVWSLFKQKPSYRHGSDLAATLENVKLEFYRRVMVPYEDKKIRENGDLGDVFEAGEMLAPPI